MSRGLYSKKSSTISGNRSKQKDKKFSVYDFFSSETHSEEDDAQFQQRVQDQGDSPLKANRMNTLLASVNQKLRAATMRKDSLNQSSVLGNQKQGGCQAEKRAIKILQASKSREDEFIPFSSQFESTNLQGASQQLTIHDVLDQTYHQEMSTYEKDHPFEVLSQSPFQHSLAKGENQQSSQGKVKFINFKDQLHSDESETNLTKRPTNQKLLNSTKEMFQFKLQKLEERIKKKVLEEEQLKIKKIKIMDLQSKSNLMNPLACMRDKLKGKFNLCLREDLSMRLKVANFAQEPLSFHIHKNRQMFPKLLELEKRRIDKIQAEKERQKLEKQGSQFSLNFQKDKETTFKLESEQSPKNLERRLLSKGAISISNLSLSPRHQQDKSSIRHSAGQIQDFRMDMKNRINANLLEASSSFNLSKFGQAVIDVNEARGDEKRKARALRFKSQRFNLRELGVTSNEQERQYLFSSQEKEQTGVMDEKSLGLLSATPRKNKRIQRNRQINDTFSEHEGQKVFSADIQSHEAQQSTEKSMPDTRQNFHKKVQFPKTQHFLKRSLQIPLNRKPFNISDIQNQHSSQIYAKPQTSHFASLSQIINNPGALSQISPHQIHTHRTSQSL